MEAVPAVFGERRGYTLDKFSQFRVLNSRARFWSVGETLGDPAEPLQTRRERPWKSPPFPTYNLHAVTYQQWTTARPRNCNALKVTNKPPQKDSKLLYVFKHTNLSYSPSDFSVIKRVNPVRGLQPAGTKCSEELMIQFDVKVRH